MDFLDIIHTRRSIRKFTPDPVSVEALEKILRAGMVSPTATNSQSWRFIVVDEREILDEITRIHPYAKPAADAPLAIVVCGDMDAGHAPEFWPQDAAAATQTMMLAARALELGSLWCGIHPHTEREDAFIKLLDMPGNIRPFALLIIGHPLQPFTREDRFDKTKVHHNRW